MTTTILCNQHPAAVPVLDLLNRLSQIFISLASQVAALWSGRQTRMQLGPSRQVSILFTDVVGFSHLMTAWPLELVVSSLTRYFEGLSQCVYRHGGQVDKFIGDGMLAVFESPDDAVSAAYAIQREVAGYNSKQRGQARCSFPTRIVIDTGLVVKTNLGPHRDRDWTVMGPVVNTASHLAQILPPDRVFISHSTRCQIINRSDLQLTDPQTVDGCGDRLVVYEVATP